MERQPEEERNEKDLIKTTELLINGGKIVTEGNGVINSLGPDGRIAGNVYICPRTSSYSGGVSIGFDRYLRLYRESWARLHKSTPSLGSYQDRTLCSTWQLSYDQFLRQNRLAANMPRGYLVFQDQHERHATTDLHASSRNRRTPPTILRPTAEQHYAIP